MEGADESTVGYLLHPDDREMAFDALRALLTGQNDIHQNTYRLKQHDGSYHWVLIRGKKLRDASGDTGMVLVSWIDIHDKVQVELALRESEEKYRLLADNAADYIQLLSIDGKYLYDSPSVVRLLGDNYQSGRRLAEGVTLIHPDDRALARDTLVDVFRSGSERRLDYRWVLPSGEVRWVEGLGRAVRNERGEVESALLITRDITDRKQALDQARFANEAKSQFLSRVSHELRTPLNAVVSYSYLLGKTGLNTRQSAYLDQITASSQQLLGLISDVLDLARIEAGKQSVKAAPFMLSALLDSALDVVRPAAQASGLELVCDDTGHLPQQLVGDEALIMQALQMARARHYAAVLMDLRMPQMNGIEATRLIRQLPGWQQVPIVALTADVFTETRESCLAAGMSEFLGKPLDPGKLYPLLLRVLDAEQAD